MSFNNIRINNLQENREDVWQGLDKRLPQVLRTIQPPPDWCDRDEQGHGKFLYRSEYRSLLWISSTP